MIEKNILERRKEHIKQVGEWLEKNVIVYRNISSVTLHRFTWDSKQGDGEFFVRFDDHECPYQFRFDLGLHPVFQQQYFSITIPIFHSPLGAPASFGAIDIEDNVLDTIKRALENVLPKVKLADVDKSDKNRWSFQGLQKWIDLSEMQRFEKFVSSPESSFTETVR